MESTHCSQDLGAACLALGQKDGKRGKLVLLLCTAQGLWQCSGEGRHPDPPEPHICSARLGLHPAALDAWEGREAAEHIQTWLPGGDKLVPLGHMCLGECGRVQALGAPQHPKEGQKAHKSHSQAVTPSELHDTAGWGVKAGEQHMRSPRLQDPSWGWGSSVGIKDCSSLSQS